MLELRVLSVDRLPREADEVIGLVADDTEAQLVVAAFPGRGRCYLWDPLEGKKLRIISWENSR